MYKILVTLGPSSLNSQIIKLIENQGVYLFRINLSHTKIEQVEDIIQEIRKCSDIPICLDSEGAQIRNQTMAEGKVFLRESSTIKVHFDNVLGDSFNISFSPNYIAPLLEVGDELTIDFDEAKIKIIEKHADHCLAKVITPGSVGSNKAADLLNKQIELYPITEKDKKAIAIGRKNGIKHFALSFAANAENVKQFRELTGNDSKIISKIESRSALYNLNGIIEASDEILIDRGDLSRQVPLEKIPFFQRRIVSFARNQGTPVYVATNLLESMIKSAQPTRAEVNDVISTLMDGANGLVLAAETAVGRFPVKSVEMIRSLINQLECWTPNTSIEELLENNSLQN
jgi:pyruvate kinase